MKRTKTDEMWLIRGSQPTSLRWNSSKIDFLIVRFQLNYNTKIVLKFVWLQSD